MAPERSGSLRKFVTRAKETFSVTINKKYDESIWIKHEGYLKDSDSYNSDLHYPVLIMLEKMQ